MKPPRRDSVEPSHPNIDTFERVLEGGVMVDQVRDTSPRGHHSTVDGRLHVSIFGMDQLERVPSRDERPSSRRHKV